MNGNNKTELIKFLVRRWGSHPSIIGNLQLFVAYEEKCIFTKADCVCPFPSLESNQEEADIRMLLHVKYISPSISNVVIHTPDTDVFVLHLQHQLNSQLTYSFKRKAKDRHGLYPLRTSSNHCVFNMMSTIEKWLLNLYLLHAFTGCVTISAICGKGKVKPPKILLKSRRYIVTFTNAGADSSLGENAGNVFQQCL